MIVSRGTGFQPVRVMRSVDAGFHQTTGAEHLRLQMKIASLLLDW
jgi:hypothetical protein